MLPALGYPWDAMLAAAAKAEAAARRMLEAGTAGDVNAKARAELDRAEAQGEWLAVKEELARLWLAGLRAVLEQRPGELAELLAAMPPSDAAVRELREIEDRVDAAENYVVKLLTGRASA